MITIARLPRYPRCLLASILALPVLPLAAQTVNSTASPPAQEPVIELSPFEVLADPTDTYQANSTQSVTGTNRDIRTLPLTMEAFNRTFIDDIAASTLDEILQFATNIQDNQDSLEGGNGQGQDFRIRGLLSRGERRRNGFLSLLRSDTFNMDRTELLRGPQSLLYGQGVSAGTINTVTKRPVSRDFEEVRFALDQYGTTRSSLDLNHNFGKLGVRLNGLRSRQKYWYENIHEDSDAIDVALSYKLAPKWTLRASGYYLGFYGVRRFADDTELRDNSKTSTGTPNPTFLSFIIPGQEKPNDIVINGEPLSIRNAFSLAGAALGTDRVEHDQTVSLEGEVIKNLNVRLAYNHSTTNQFIITKDNSTLANASQLVVAPTDSAAATDDSGVKQYSVDIDPQRTYLDYEVETYQAAAVYGLKLGKVLTSQFIAGGEIRQVSQQTGFQTAYEVDADGNFVRVTPVNNQYQRTGRLRMAPYFYPINGPYLSDYLGSNPLVKSGAKRYAWGNITEPVTDVTAAFTKNGYVTDQGASNAANGTPFGNDPQVLRDEKQKAAYLDWLGTWFGGRVETMAGGRTDNVSVVDSQTGVPLEQYHVNENSGLLGVIVNIGSHFGVYANKAKSFTAASALRKDWDGNGLAPTSGRGKEIGIKFDLFEQRISGSVAYYQNSSNNENFQVPTAIRNAIDPAQMGSSNNRYSTQFQQALPFTPVPNYSDGYEVGLSFQPVRRMRISLNYGMTDGVYTADINHALYYNDQFYTRTAGADTVVQARIVNNGALTDQYADVMVRSVRGNNTSALVPLTVAMLQAAPASTGYGVTYDAAGNGRVSNWATFFPTGTASTVVHPTANGLPVFASAVLPNGFTSGGVIATGALGLPIAEHQLGFVPNATGDDPRFFPGTQLYRIFQAGDKTGGYAERTLTMNANYSFSDGFLRGVSVGATFRYLKGVRRTAYTSYPDGTRELRYAPDNYTLGLRAGYQRKLKKFLWTSQINATNVVRSNAIVYRINDADGTITGFNYNNIPATYLWTNTFRF